MLKHGILGLINYHEMTGYEIMQAFRDPEFLLDGTDEPDLSGVTDAGGKEMGQQDFCTAAGQAKQKCVLHYGGGKV